MDGLVIRLFQCILGPTDNQFCDRVALFDLPLTQFTNEVFVDDFSYFSMENQTVPSRGIIGREWLRFLNIEVLLT